MSENCNDTGCSMLFRIEALERDSRHNKDAHEKIYNQLENSRTSMAVTEERIEQIQKDAEEIKTIVQELNAKPGKRWESLIGYLMCAAVGAFLGWIASGMPGL